MSLALFAAGPRAAAAPNRITGKLNKPGYTVIALAAGGGATAVVARRGRFRLRPRAERVTLQLRAPDGVYAGPVVIRGQGRWALLGVRAGARLGGIAVRAGYARPARRVPSRWVDATRRARARRGVPIGARVFGRVRSRRAGRDVPGDRDRDGIPNPLDIDDDGDLILDSLDGSSRARASQAPGEFVNSFMSLALHETANANAAALTTEHVNAALSSNGLLKLGLPPGDSVELDCGRPQSRFDPSVGGLVYCSSGGTGRVPQPGVPPSDFPPFPGDRFGPFDPDGDGFGTPQTLATAPDTMLLRHGATTAQIGTGDVLIYRVTTNGVESQLAGAVEYVFATVPALVSHDDGQGHAATLSYPIMPGPATSAVPVAARTNGDVIVRLTFWRPQRTPIPPEAGEWVDIGRLYYQAQPSDADVGPCPQSTLSESDANLAEGTQDENFSPPAGGFIDLAGDQPANPANTFTYTLNLTQCLALRGLSFNPGETRTFFLVGNTLGGGAAQTVSFKRQ